MKRPSERTSKIRKKRRKNPSHRTVTRAFSFPLEVSQKQANILNDHIAACWCLRNYLVHDRTENRRENRRLKQQGKETSYLTCADQYSSIKEYRKRDVGLSKVHSQVFQNVAVRVDEGYKRFFEALQAGNSSVGPPKFIEWRKYKSLTYPQYGPSARVRNGVLSLSRIGNFRICAYRKIRGRAKAVTVNCKQGSWWAVITAEMLEKDAVMLVQNGDSRIDAGIDPGIRRLLCDSKGNYYDPPKAFFLDRARLRKEQKKMSRQFDAEEGP